MMSATAWLSERLPSERDLERAELAALATAVGRERELWQHLVRHDPGERYFVELYRDPHVDVWLICWLEGQDTGFHDHDISSGAVYVCDGTLLERRYHLGRGGIREASRKHPAGSGFDFDAAYIHRLGHASGAEATSVHAYSPALWRMGYYDFDACGDLCRTSVTYADEMWQGASTVP